MKKLLFILAASAATAGTAFAQIPVTAPAQAGTAAVPDQLAQRRAQYLAKELGLTQENSQRFFGENTCHVLGVKKEEV